ncbi:RNA polymerase recycling motor HelD [Paenibacillus humicola]|uniref:RNA polymerase recycling motor HelD n=1 Tax=Paenibacillus humicola TaxID=3110540 RepID=UPI00237B9114|nr:RNA polymerase recycling motor HelD [Paenibacillus humicola]
MSEADREWAVEQRRVDEVTAEIDRRLKHLELQTSDVRSEMVEIRTNFWEDVTVNFEDAAEAAETFASMKQQAELLSERERTHGQAAKQLITLGKLRHSPYFGRIDFLEAGERETECVYLGIASLRDRTDEHYLIYDWRAPVSSLYYDYPPGPAKYETPVGEIEGELQLKRQFVIRGGRIVSLFDTGVTIGDELLQEVLGRQSDAQMRSIVATIQREQNRIIRNERSRLLLVQGAAGSGKTSAALQRVAYLLYRYRGTLRADQIVLFSPNPMFGSYVSTVLPELGEENMQQTTFQDYLAFRLGRSFRLENPYDQLEAALTAPQSEETEIRLEAIRFKSSAAFVALIDRYLAYLGGEGLRFRDLKFRDETIKDGAAIAEHFYSIDRSVSLPGRMKLTAEWLLRQLKERERTAVSEPWVDEEVGLLDKEAYLKAYQTVRRNNGFHEESFDDYDRERELLARYVAKERMKPLRARVKRLAFVDLKEVYRKLFADPSFARAFAGEEALPARWEAICKRTLDRLERGEMAYEDATPFLYAIERVRGFRTNTSVRHILIDEAQDYTAFQFAFLKRLFPHAKVTALGDLNQSIHAHRAEGDGGFGALAALYPPEETETIMLNRSYRSTRQIVEFTSLLIEGGSRIEPFNRSGEKPALTRAADTPELHRLIEERIRRLLSGGSRTIAVICKTARESRSAYETLRVSIPALRLIEAETNTFEPGVVVIPSYLAKGVEFDAVLVYDASDRSYGLESERRLFYTVCTRAMHSLCLFAAGSWSPLIPEEAKRLCETVTEAGAAKSDR